MSDLIASELDNFAQNYNIQGAVPQLPPKASKGNSFDFGSIVVQSDEDFARLPESQKQLLRNMKQGIQYTPAAAAQFVEEFNTRQAELSSPKAQAEAAKAQLDLAAAQAEAKSKANEKIEDSQKTYQRASNMLWLLDNLRGGKRGEVAENSEKWRPRVGSVDGRWPSFLSSEETLGWNADFASLKGMINLEEAQRNRGQGSLTEGERALMAQAASLGLEQARDEKGFNASFERMYDIALEAQQREMKKLSGADKFNSSSAPQTQAPPVQQQLPAFQSKEQIMQAVNSGQISREQAVQALRSQFGNQFK